MHRFIVSTEEIIKGEVILQGDEFIHLQRVLRLGADEIIALFDGKGIECIGKIVSINTEAAVISIIKCSKNLCESPLELWLMQGLPKGDKMDLIIQKCTELGIKGIVPLIMSRSDVKIPADKQNEKVKRWKRIATEAAKQCGRTAVPMIQPVSSLKLALQNLPKHKVFIVPWEKANLPLHRVLDEQEDPSYSNAPVYITIGPEGGLTEEEISLICEFGGSPVSIGPRILRTETAAIAVTALLMARWGDLG